MENDKDTQAPLDKTESRQAYLAPSPGAPDMFPHLLNDDDLNSSAPPPQTQPRKFHVSKWALLIIVVTSVVALGLGGYSYYLYATGASLKNTASDATVPTPQTPSDAQGSPTQSITDTSLSFKLFVPANSSWERPRLLLSPDKSRGMLTYSRNVQFGNGIVKGSYGFYVFPKAGSAYNPPSDCPLPMLTPQANSTPRPCTRYVGSSSIAAYTIDEQAFPGIQNTSVESYISLYAERDGSVIVIESADTSAADLYDILMGMKELPVSQLPKDAIQQL